MLFETYLIKSDEQILLRNTILRYLLFHFINYLIKLIYTLLDAQCSLQTEVKGKAVPQHTYGGAGMERKYSSYSFTISALYGVSGQRHAPAALYPRGKNSHRGKLSC
jgi:hypothetical protein